MNNNYNSYTNNILGNAPGLSFKGSLGFFDNFLPSNLRTNYSYIKVDNKKYTVVKTTILNDIFNHPGYKKMIDSYNKINLIRMAANINKKIEIVAEKFYIIMNKMRDKGMMTELKKKLEKVLADEITRRAQERELYHDQRVQYKIDIEYIKQYISDLNTIINIAKNSDNISNMETLTEKTDKISMYIPTKINKILKEIKDILKQYELLNTILEKHMTNEKININFDKDTTAIIQEKYKNYYNFGKELLNNNNLKSSNPEFQNMLDNFIKGDENDFSQYMKIITTILEGKILPKDAPQMIKLFYVGLRYYDDDDEYDAVYEVYVKLDVFGGILNDSIDIGCKYRGEDLGSYFDKEKKMKWEVKNGIYIDIDNITKPPQPQPPIQSPIPQPQPPKKKGGKYTQRRRFIHNNNNNTRRRRKI